MGDIMYTVEKIEENIVKLEDRDKGIFFDVLKDVLPFNIKEGDIIDFIDGDYIFNHKKTRDKKNNIRNKFETLMK